MKTLPKVEKENIVRILERLNAAERILIVKQKNGRLRFYDPQKYYKHNAYLKKAVKEWKPWKKREKSPDSMIEAVELGSSSNLSRTEIYGDLQP